MTSAAKRIPGAPDRRDSAPRIDEASPLCRIVFRQQAIERDIDERRVRQPLVAVGERDLHGLDEVVIVIGRTLAPRGDVEAFDEVQDLQGREALRRRRQLHDVEATVSRSDRFHPSRLYAVKISALV